jgi:hypothetical protein
MHLGHSCQGGRKQWFLLQSASPSTAGALPHDPLLLDTAIPINIHRLDELATILNSN